MPPQPPADLPEPLPPPPPSSEPERRRGPRGRRTRLACIFYTLGLAGLLAAFRLVGEEVWWLALLLYFPLGFWLLPMLALAPLAWLRDRRSLLLLAGGLLIVFTASGWQWRSAPPPITAEGQDRLLRIVSYNIGEDNETSVLPFLEKHQPDLFFLQSTFHRSRTRSRYQPADGAKMHTRAGGQFELQSRYPIRRVETIRWANYQRPIAARYEIDWQGRTLIAYSLHLPTPRPLIMTLLGMTDGEKPIRTRIASVRRLMHERRELRRELLERIRSTPDPLLVVGDFNMPAWGRDYHLLRAEFTDPFLIHGRGFGYTFPGHDPYIPTPLGPWLRLDYLFCGPHWQPLTFDTERNRESQHLAIAATLRYPEEAP